jgi:hypothetical protein
MNIDSLSDEAFWKWDEQFDRLHFDKSFSEHALDGWRECARRAKANRWAAFSDEELREICQDIGGALGTEAGQELDRREGLSQLQRFNRSSPLTAAESPAEQPRQP